MIHAYELEFSDALMIKRNFRIISDHILITIHENDLNEDDSMMLGRFQN